MGDPKRYVLVPRPAAAPASGLRVRHYSLARLGRLERLEQVVERELRRPGNARPPGR